MKKLELRIKRSELMHMKLEGGFEQFILESVCKAGFTKTDPMVTAYDLNTNEVVFMQCQVSFYDKVKQWFKLWKY
jgi:hypothetical protein